MSINIPEATTVFGEISRLHLSQSERTAGAWHLPCNYVDGTYWVTPFPLTIILDFMEHFHISQGVASFSASPVLNYSFPFSFFCLLLVCNTLKKTPEIHFISASICILKPLFFLRNSELCKIFVLHSNEQRVLFQLLRTLSPVKMI